MIKSERHLGLIKRGSTKLDLTINVEQTAPMQLTITKGQYTDVQGNLFSLENDVVLDFVADTVYAKNIAIALVKHTVSGSVEVWVDEVLRDGDHSTADPPAGYEVLTHLVGYGWFTIPPNTTDLSSIDIYCMKVIE